MWRVLISRIESSVDIVLRGEYEYPDLGRVSILWSGASINISLWVKIQDEYFGLSIDMLLQVEIRDWCFGSSINIPLWVEIWDWCISSSTYIALWGKCQHHILGWVSRFVSVLSINIILGAIIDIIYSVEYWTSCRILGSSVKWIEHGVGYWDWALSYTGIEYPFGHWDRVLSRVLECILRSTSSRLYGHNPSWTLD